MAEDMEFEKVEAVQAKEMPNMMPALLERIITPLIYFNWQEETNDIRDPTKFRDFHVKTFKSFANFILSIYDVEDFERFLCKKEIFEECKNLYGELWKKEADGHDPIKLIAEREIDLKKFSLLREVDIACILERLVTANLFGKGPERYNRTCVLDFGLLARRVSVEMLDRQFDSTFSETARMLAENYIPLKEDLKQHVILEYVMGTCACISHTLYAEALHESGILSLEEKLPDCHEQLSMLAWEMHVDLQMLSDCRLQCLKRYGSLIIYPLCSGAFGPFADEVVQLVKIAEARRRFEGHRFISVWHILWAIGFTEIEGCVLKLMGKSGLKSSREEPAEYPQYGIYASARDVADALGDKVVAIEHLVLAIVFQRSEGSRRVKNKKLKTVHGAGPSVADHTAMWNVIISKERVQLFLKSVAEQKMKSDGKIVKLITSKMKAPIIHDHYRAILETVVQFDNEVKTGRFKSAALRDGVV